MYCRNFSCSSIKTFIHMRRSQCIRRSLTASQPRSFRAGEIWSNFLKPVRIRAAKVLNLLKLLHVLFSGATKTTLSSNKKAKVTVPNTSEFRIIKSMMDLSKRCRPNPINFRQSSKKRGHYSMGPSSRPQKT